MVPVPAWSSASLPVSRSSRRYLLVLTLASRLFGRDRRDVRSLDLILDCALTCANSAGLLGYFFKTKFGKDKDDDIDDAVVSLVECSPRSAFDCRSQFNKNDFRHESILLQDDDNLSMRSGSAMGSLNAAGMGRCAHCA
jgi:hypothetical protein